MDNNKKLSEGLLRADGINPAGATESERIAFGKMLDEQSKSKQSRPSVAWSDIWRIIMKSRITKFAAAAAIVAAIVVSVTVWNSSIPTASASAVQVLTDAAKAVGDVQSIHIKARMRTLPHDNFGMIGLKFDFVPIEMWKKVDDAGIMRWRIEKPGRVIVMDGNSTTMLIRPNHAVKGERPYPIGCFDTWYGHLMNVNEIIDNALKATMNRFSDQLCMRNEVLKDGSELVLEIESSAQGDFTNDWCKNTFIIESDHKKVYRFEAETKLLKGFEVFVHTDKEDVLVFEVTDIEYNPQIDNGMFMLELPADVIWHQEPKPLADNEKYEKMTPKEAAEAFFKACAEENWDEVLKFMSSSRVDDRLKEYYGGLEIISIGEPFKSGIYAGWLVPYEIRLRPTEINVRLSKENSAGRFVITGMYDSKLQLQEEIKWSNEPEILTDNDTYAKMSPEDVAKAYFGAFSRLDFDEMRKFMPESYVASLKGEVREAAKRGIDVQKQLPIVEVGEAFWSAEHSAYFVKCRNLGRVKEWKMGVRNDNPAKRWVVDGGI